MSDASPLRVVIPSPLLNDPTWFAKFRRLAREMLDIAREIERFGSLPDYQEMFFRTRLVPCSDEFAEHVRQAVERAREAEDGFAYHESIYEPYRLACYMIEDVRKRIAADPAARPIPVTALARIVELLGPDKTEKREEDQPGSSPRKAEALTLHEAAEAMRASTGDDDGKNGDGTGQKVRPVICFQASVARWLKRSPNTTGLIAKLVTEGILSRQEKRGSKFAVWFADPETHRRALDEISEGPMPPKS